MLDKLTVNHNARSKHNTNNMWYTSSEQTKRDQLLQRRSYSPNALRKNVRCEQNVADHDTAHLPPPPSPAFAFFVEEPSSLKSTLHVKTCTGERGERGVEGATSAREESGGIKAPRQRTGERGERGDEGATSAPSPRARNEVQAPPLYK